MSEVELVYKVRDRAYSEGHNPTNFVEHVHYVRGQKGGVSFGWVECLEPEKLSPQVRAILGVAQARDVGYHRHEREAEWEYEAQDCIVTGGVCYGDGSSLRARDLLDEWEEVGKDESWLRARLAQEYNDRFYPDHERTVSEMTFSETISKVFGMPE